MHRPSSDSVNKPMSVVLVDSSDDDDSDIEGPAYSPLSNTSSCEDDYPDCTNETDEGLWQYMYY